LRSEAPACEVLANAAHLQFDAKFLLNELTHRSSTPKADPSANRRTLASLIDQGHGSDLYLAPELWTSGYVQSQWAKLADEDSPLSLEWMADEARLRGVWIGGSLIAANPDGTLANRFVLFDRSGTLACQYDKTHLFRPLQEDVFLRAGDRAPTIIEV
jgi:predicted amidohydrolase